MGETVHAGLGLAEGDHGVGLDPGGAMRMAEGGAGQEVSGVHDDLSGT